MNTTSTTVVSTKALLSGWERALLLLPALAGLFFGFAPLFFPVMFANLIQFPAESLYVYQLAGAATLGYGVTLCIGLFQKAWLPLRLPVAGVLVFNLASLYACAASIYDHQAPFSVFVVLCTSVLFVVITSLLLIRHRSAPRPDFYRPSGLLRVGLIIGGLSAAIFGLVPLVLPGPFFPLFPFQMGVTGIARQAGAACLGYAALSLLVQQGIDRREIPLSAIMAAVFNGCSGLMSIPYLLAGKIFLLPWIIVPVGLAALVISLFILRSAFLYKVPAQVAAAPAEQLHSLT
ncbi:MAG TPA: hypothetical protein VGD98_15015 [Ktedonobacteraceae bacterium]